jgi:hypothetical protein
MVPEQKLFIINAEADCTSKPLLALNTGVIAILLSPGL